MRLGPSRVKLPSETRWTGSSQTSAEMEPNSAIGEQVDVGMAVMHPYSKFLDLAPYIVAAAPTNFRKLISPWGPTVEVSRLLPPRHGSVGGEVRRDECSRAWTDMQAAWHALGIPGPWHTVRSLMRKFGTRWMEIPWWNLPCMDATTPANYKNNQKQNYSNKALGNPKVLGYVNKHPDCTQCQHSTDTAGHNSRTCKINTWPTWAPLGNYNPRLLPPVGMQALHAPPTFLSSNLQSVSRRSGTLYTQEPLCHERLLRGQTAWYQIVPLSPHEATTSVMQQFVQQSAALTCTCCLMSGNPPGRPGKRMKNFKVDIPNPRIHANI